MSMILVIVKNHGIGNQERSSGPTARTEQDKMIVNVVILCLYVLMYSDILVSRINLVLVFNFPWEL